MARITPPLFGSDWTEGQIERFEEIKSDDVILAVKYEFVEATLRPVARANLLPKTASISIRNRDRTPCLIEAWRRNRRP